MNTFPRVFNMASDDHGMYKPVLEWIVAGKGKIVCGGSGYWDELKKLGKYNGLLKQLNAAGKVVKIDNHSVDCKAKKLKIICADADFDDPHIVALLIVSGCNLICSEDERSYKYITKKEWYPNGSKPPKIYKKSTFNRASSVLSDKNIADICKPCQKINKNRQKALYNES